MAAGRCQAEFQLRRLRRCSGWPAPDAPQGHRQHDRQSHGAAQPHLLEPANERPLEPEWASQNRLVTGSRALRWS